MIKNKKGGVASVPLEQAIRNNYKKCMDDCMEKKRRRVNRLLDQDGRRTYNSVVHNYYDKYAVMSDKAECEGKCRIDLSKHHEFTRSLKKHNLTAKRKNYHKGKKIARMYQHKLDQLEQKEIDRTKEQFNKYKDNISSITQKHLSPKKSVEQSIRTFNKEPTQQSVHPLTLLPYKGMSFYIKGLKNPFSFEKKE